MFELPNIEDELGETGRDLFGGAKPRWNDFDEDDELPMGRATMKARSREIVKDKGSPVRPPISGAENGGNFRFPQPPPPASLGAENGGYGRFQPQQQGGYGYQPHQPPAMMKPPHAASSLRPQPPSSQGGNNWQISDDMMNQPWGTLSPRAHTLLPSFPGSPSPRICASPPSPPLAQPTCLTGVLSHHRVGAGTVLRTLNRR